VVGRPSCDLIFAGLPEWPRPGNETYSSVLTLSAGGCFNLAASASRLGLRVGFVGLMGADLWGDVIRAEVEREGVGTELLRTAEAPLPAVSIALSADGDRGFVTHEPDVPVADRELSVHAERVFARVRAGHTHMDLRSNVLTLAPMARRYGMTISADTGGWESWLRSREVWDLLPLIDLLFTNESEAEHMTGLRDMREAAARLSGSCETVVIKRGPRGALCLTGGELIEVATRPIDPVIDATGAGDCFNAGFLYGRLRDLSPERCLRLGNLCGGLAVQAVGGHQGAPTEARLLELMRDAGLLEETM